MTITIRNLAAKLHLSITTVSRALDGYADVAEETRQRVVQTAQAMGYEPNYSARQLRRKRTDTVGYILPSSAPQFTDPFYIDFLSGLCDEVASQHLDLLVTSCPPGSESEKEQYRRWTQSRRVDGIVFNRTRVSDWRIEYLAQHGIPFVSLGRGETNARYPYIEISDTIGFQKLVAHLIDKGHRRIAFIGASPDLIVHLHRLAGYQQALAEAGISFDPGLVRQGDLTEEGGYQASLDLLRLPDPPTAIVGVNDLTALGVMQAAKEHGTYIGTELAIAGYDGIKETEFTNPPLTTLYQPTYEIARRLANMLLRLLDGENLSETQVTIEPQLLIRASTG